MGNLIKGPDDHLVIGDYNAVCSMCGAKRKASKMVQNWQGQWRCPQHNEPRQPQDFVRGVPDIVTPPWVQKPTSLYTQICTYNGISAIPGLAIPGCMIPGRAIWDQDFYPPLPPPPPITVGPWYWSDPTIFFSPQPNVIVYFNGEIQNLESN